MEGEEAELGKEGRGPVMVRGEAFAVLTMLGSLAILVSSGMEGVDVQRG